MAKNCGYNTTVLTAHTILLCVRHYNELLKTASVLEENDNKAVFFLI